MSIINKSISRSTNKAKV